MKLRSVFGQPGPATMKSAAKDAKRCRRVAVAEPEVKTGPLDFQLNEFYNPPPYDVISSIQIYAGRAGSPCMCHRRLVAMVLAAPLPESGSTSSVMGPHSGNCSTARPDEPNCLPAGPSGNSRSGQPVLPPVQMYYAGKQDTFLDLLPPGPARDLASRAHASAAINVPDQPPVHLGVDAVAFFRFRRCRALRQWVA